MTARTVTPLVQRSSNRWACLMYHEVTPSDEPNAGGYFSVPHDRFAAQLGLLAKLGLLGTSMEQAVNAARPVVAITFDDGHESHYAEAYPQLVRHGMTATFFVVTGWVGKRGYVTWPQLRDMARAGMSIQSHTHSHPFLSELSRERVMDELRRSKQMLDDQLDQATTSIAFPGGDAPRGWSATEFASLGYRWVATSRWGPNLVGSPDHAVRRYTVRRDASADSFAALAGAMSPAWSPEGVRLLTLNVVRTAMGPTRYARLRRSALRALGR